MSRTSGAKQQNSGHIFTLAKQTALYQQHLDKEFCDVVIKIKDEEFYVHGCIVAASCPKLQRMIDERKVHVNIPNHPSVEVEIDESIFSAKIFEFILAYIYLGVLDWSKVAPNLVNEVLSAASWCEFYQLVEDYMASNHEEDNDDGMAGSTIIMVDTCDDSDNAEVEEEPIHEEVLDFDSENQDTTSDVISNEVEALYCMLCGLQFELGDEISLAEHMQIHEDADNGEPTTRRNVTRRKASLGLKSKYKSLIPNYKDDSKTIENDDYVVKKPSRTRNRKSTKNQGRVLLFKNSFQCQQCNKKLASQKALNHHLRNFCPLRDNVEEEDEEVAVPLTTAEIASQLVTELASEEPEGSILRSTKGVTVRTGMYVRPYVKKRGRKENNEKDEYVEKKIKTTKLWICPHCPDYVFERKRDQIFHIRSVHGVIKRHVCDQCGKSLEGRSALALHMRIHTGERPFVCTTCGRGFSERKTMEDHTRRHTGERPFLCTVCGKDFTYRQSLFRHMKFHTGERPHHCHICGKTFVLKQNLQEHITRHDKHQLMACTQCDAKFANKDILLKHQLEVHVIENNVSATEVEQEQPQRLQYINVSEMALAPNVGNYEVTIENQMVDSYPD